MGSVFVMQFYESCARDITGRIIRVLLMRQDSMSHRQTDANGLWKDNRFVSVDILFVRKSMLISIRHLCQDVGCQMTT